MKEQPTNKEIDKVADKVIACNASEWVIKTFSIRRLKTMDLSDQRIVLGIVRGGAQIYPGMPYIEEHGVYNNKPYVSRYIKEIHQLCLKYGLYSYTGKSNVKLS